MTAERLAEHDHIETTLVMQAASDSLQQLREHGSSGARFVKSGLDVFVVIVRYDRKGLVDVPRIGRERLAELIDKVSHGYNLINSEAREVLEHFGVAVEQRNRCEECQGEGDRLYPMPLWGPHVEQRRVCVDCNGTGYEVRE